MHRLSAFSLWLFNILSYQCKKQRTVILLQLFGASLFSVNYLMLGATVGGILNILGVIRAVVFIFKDKFKADSLLWLVGFGISYFAVYVLNFALFGKEVTPFNLIIELLPVIGMLSLNIGFRLKNSSDIRKCALISSPSCLFTILRQVRWVQLFAKLSRWFRYLWECSATIGNNDFFRRIKIKKTLWLFLTAILMMTFTSCSGGIKGDEAKETVNNFLQAVEEKDWERAEEYLHPERPIDVQKFFSVVESREDLDFSKVDIIKYSAVRSSMYDGSVKGAVYGFTVQLSLSGKNTQMEVEFVKNDGGYGIYNLDFKVD